MPRKTTTIVTCSYNGCKEFAEVYDSAEAPQGWYQVRSTVSDPKHGFTYDSKVPFEFHSLRCLEKWAGERRKFLASETTIHADNGSAPTPEALRASRENVLTAVSLMEGHPFSAEIMNESCEFASLDAVREKLRELTKEGVLRVVRKRSGSTPQLWQEVR